MRILTPCLVMLGILVWPGMGLAINFSNGSWSTSFDYPQSCSMTGAEGYPDCSNVNNDGTTWNISGNNNLGGNFTKVIPEANNPNGGSGMGYRAYVGDGTNNESGLMWIQFAQPQKEFWLRWYQRYEAGFTWSGGEPGYDKTWYIFGGSNASGPTQVIPEHGGGRFSLLAQGTPDYYQAAGNIAWTDVFGASSDGLFHLYEIYLKMDTNQNNGIGKVWIDGNLVVNASGVNWSNGSGVMQDGWTEMSIHNNQTSPNNGRIMYVDYDEIAIYNSTPPNTDNSGNPWIGPLNGSPAPKTPKGPAPVGVTFNDSIEDSNFASLGWYEKQAWY